MAEPRRWHRQGAPIWDANPPAPRVRKYERLKVDPGPALDLWIVSSELVRTWTHFVDNRTVFCTGPQGGCWLDHTQTGNARFGAWLAVQGVVRGDVGLLRLTGCALAVEGRLLTMSGSLRGLWLKVWRKGCSDKSEMRCQLELGAEVPTRLHEEIDVRYAVERMVAADDRRQGPNGMMHRGTTPTPDKGGGLSTAQLAGVR